VNGRSTHAYRTGLFALMVSLAVPAGAQELWPVSLEIAAGSDYGFAPDRFRDDHASTGAGTITFGIHPGAPEAGGFVAAAEFGTQFSGARTDDCVVGSRGECLPWPPLFSSLAGLAGWESSGGGFRILGGAGAARPDDDRGNVRLALVTRTDGFFGPRAHASVLVFARAMVVPAYLGEVHGVVSVGVGLRLR
jgi:hypothetical protein